MALTGAFVASRHSVNRDRILGPANSAQGASPVTTNTTIRFSKWFRLAPSLQYVHGLAPMALTGGFVLSRHSVDRQRILGPPNRAQGASPVTTNATKRRWATPSPRTLQYVHGLAPMALTGAFVASRHSVNRERILGPASWDCRLGNVGQSKGDVETSAGVADTVRPVRMSSRRDLCDRRTFPAFDPLPIVTVMAARLERMCRSHRAARHRAMRLVVLHKSSRPAPECWETDL